MRDVGADRSPCRCDARTERRANARNAATTSKRCGCRGTTTVSAPPGRGCAASASKIGASSPSRVEPAIQTGRPSPKRSRNSWPSASKIREPQIELEIPDHLRRRRTQLFESRASAGVCAAMPRSEASIGRDKPVDARVAVRPSAPTSGRSPETPTRRPACFRRQVGPQLRLHRVRRHAGEMGEEGAHRERQVVGQPCLRHPYRRRAPARLAPRCGHVGEQQRESGPGAMRAIIAERGARLAE